MKVLVLVALCVAIAAAFAAPPDYVPVPGGKLLHRSCVHELDESFGEILEIDDSVTVVYGNGSIFVVPRCSYETIDTRIGRNAINKRDSETSENGWVAWAVADASAGFTAFSAKWMVPERPEDNNSPATVFYWNGLEPNTRDAVIQPVLQWGKSAAGGSKEFAIASWWVNDAGKAIYTKPIQVSSGDMLVGNMTLLTNGSWVINAIDPTKKVEGRLVFTSKTKVTYGQAYYCLESYNLNSCEDYPNPKTKQLVFSGININVGKSPVNAKWAPSTQDAECSEAFKVLSSNNGQDVSLSWKT
jgi:hypothetical protein